MVGTNASWSLNQALGEGSVFMRCKIWGSHSGGYEEYYLLGYNAV
jgi:hypothetical protein